jgi:acyl-CoA thioester hydrolase
VKAVWSASVRYAEIDGQNVVFNAHYLTYCDEAMSKFCDDVGLARFSADVQLVTSTLTWKSAARWNDTVEVDVTCPRVGRTSFVLDFVVRVGERVCCEVSTTYVHIDADGRPEAVSPEARDQLTSGNSRSPAAC